MIINKTRDKINPQIKNIINFALPGYYFKNSVGGGATIKIAGAGVFAQIVF